MKRSIKNTCDLNVSPHDDNGFIAERNRLNLDTKTIELAEKKQKRRFAGNNQRLSNLRVNRRQQG